MVRGKWNLDARITRLITYRGSAYVRVRPHRLTFPLGLILQILLATRYRFFILLNVPLLLIEFKPDYQCLKEACPPFIALPGSFPPDERCTLEAGFPLSPVVDICLREKTWILIIVTIMKYVLAAD